MKLFLLALLIALGLVQMALASTGLDGDADADGAVTREQVRAAHPDLTAEACAAMEAIGEGALDAQEMTSARIAGQLPHRG